MSKLTPGTLVESAYVNRKEEYDLGVVLGCQGKDCPIYDEYASLILGSNKYCGKEPGLRKATCVYWARTDEYRCHKYGSLSRIKDEV